MGNAVALRYEVKIEDIVGFNLFQFQLRNSPGQKISELLNIVFYIACFFIGAFYLSAYRGYLDFWSWMFFIDFWSWMFFIPVCAVFVLLWFYLIKRWRLWSIKRAVHRIYSEERNRSLFGLHKLTVDDRGFWEETEVGESRVNWEGIVKLISTDTHTYIYVGAGQAHVIPRASVMEGDYDAFVAQVEEWFEQKRPALQEV